MTPCNAIGEAEFSALMAPLAPFESAPHLAVAVSGGADSMALLLLAARWARRRRGAVTALSVNHGLRAEAGREVRQVARWCRNHAINQRTLNWRDDKPKGGIQAAARDARYRLLSEYCRRRGILHLLTAHHLEDQAETLLLRLSRQTGLAGMAGMAGLAQVNGVRLLRPLLTVRRARLRETLHRLGQHWLEDPSNRDTRFSRIRLRNALAATSGAAEISAGLAHLARQAGLARHDGSAELAAIAARIVELFPAGYAQTVPAGWQALTPALRAALLAALLTNIGGRGYPPERSALARMSRDVANGDTRTLHGCLVQPRKNGLLICREAGRLPAPLPATPGPARWDRFRVDFPTRCSPTQRNGLRIAALGTGGWREVKPHLEITPPPPPVRLGLPALWSGDTVLAVPHLGYKNIYTDLPLIGFSAIFAPPRPLLEFGLRIV